MWLRRKRLVSLLRGNERALTIPASRGLASASSPSRRTLACAGTGCCCLAGRSRGRAHRYTGTRPNGPVAMSDGVPDEVISPIRALRHADAQHPHAARREGADPRAAVGRRADGPGGAGQGDRDGRYGVRRWAACLPPRLEMDARRAHLVRGTHSHAPRLASSRLSRTTPRRAASPGDLPGARPRRVSPPLRPPRRALADHARAHRRDAGAARPHRRYGCGAGTQLRRVWTTGPPRSAVRIRRRPGRRRERRRRRRVAVAGARTIGRCWRGAGGVSLRRRDTTRSRCISRTASTATTSTRTSTRRWRRARCRCCWTPASISISRGTSPTSVRPATRPLSTGRWSRRSPVVLGLSWPGDRSHPFERHHRDRSLRELAEHQLANRALEAAAEGTGALGLTSHTSHVPYTGALEAAAEGAGVRAAHRVAGRVSFHGGAAHRLRERGVRNGTRLGHVAPHMHTHSCTAHLPLLP